MFVTTRNYAPTGPISHGISVIVKSFSVTKAELRSLNAEWTTESGREFELTHDRYKFYPFLFKRHFKTTLTIKGVSSRTNVAQSWTGGPVRLWSNRNPIPICAQFRQHCILEARFTTGGLVTTLIIGQSASHYNSSLPDCFEICASQMTLTLTLGRELYSRERINAQT